MVALALLAYLKFLVALNGGMAPLKSRLIYAGFQWSGFLIVFKRATRSLMEMLALLKGVHVFSSLLSRSSSATILRTDSRTAFSRASLCLAS
jgi:hypothetical protein